MLEGNQGHAKRYEAIQAVQNFERRDEIWPLSALQTGCQRRYSLAERRAVVELSVESLASWYDQNLRVDLQWAREEYPVRGLHCKMTGTGKSGHNLWDRMDYIPSACKEECWVLN